jgi:hypothetical protein
MTISPLFVPMNKDEPSGDHARYVGSEDVLVEDEDVLPRAGNMLTLRPRALAKCKPSGLSEPIVPDMLLMISDVPASISSVPSR